MGKIDLLNGTVQYWDEPDTSSTYTINVDRIQKRVYAAIYNSEEQYANMLAGAESPRHTICSFDYNLGDKREILRKDDMTINTIYAMDNIILYNARDTLAPPSNVAISQILDINNMNVLFESDEEFSTKGSFSSDKRGAYVIDSASDNGIYYYDFETQDYIPIIKSEVGSIANFLVIYD